MPDAANWRARTGRACRVSMAETDVVAVLASTLSCHMRRHSTDNSRQGLNNSIFCIPLGVRRSVSTESVQINTDRRLSATAKDVRSGSSAPIAIPEPSLFSPQQRSHLKEADAVHGW